jgi:predicted N-formylglutamate amidohydrolase
VLFDRAARFGASIQAHLQRDPALNVGINVPYSLSAADDYSLPTHGDAWGNPALQIEIRQDLIADRGGAQAWAERIAAALRDGLSTSDEVAQRRMLRARGLK